MDTKNKYGRAKPIAGVLYGDFPRAISAVIDAATHGLQDHSRSAWLNTPNGVIKYTDALHRHLLTEQNGEIINPDSGLHHAAHAAWNALARLELILIDKEG